MRSTNKIIIDDVYIGNPGRVAAHNISIARFGMPVGISVVAPIVHYIVYKLIDAFYLRISCFIADIKIAYQTDFAIGRLHKSTGRMIVPMQTMANNGILNGNIVRTCPFIVPIYRKHFVGTPRKGHVIKNHIGSI